MTRSWFVTGSRGQLGSALIECLARRGASHAGCDIDVLDVADADAVRTRLATLPRPLVWANAAAFTRVDRCEREPEAARRANALAPAVLARACAEADDVQLVHVSTDYVFGGDARQPYREDDAPAPRSVYGRTKLEGERAVLESAPGALVIRTSWLFGAGRNFIAALLEQAAQRRSGREAGPLRVVDDQHGRPTYAADLADALVRLVEAGADGVVHAANGGVATWWEVARHALDEAGFSDLEIERIASSELSVGAPRPAWSVLDTSRAESFGVKLRSWQEAVSAYLRSDHSPLAQAGGS